MCWYRAHTGSNSALAFSVVTLECGRVECAYQRDLHFRGSPRSEAERLVVFTIGSGEIARPNE